MENKRLAKLSKTWRRVYQRGKQQIALLTADEMTRMSWARTIKSVADIPDVYRPHLETYLSSQRDFPGAILTPTYQGFMRQENERLLFCMDGLLLVLERLKDSSIVPVIFPLEEIDCVELGAVLLKAWLTVTGTDAYRRPQRITVKFNAVSEHLFFPLVKQIRSYGSGDLDAESGYQNQSDLDGITDAERRRFDELEQTSFKFMNYARRSLLPGEQVVSYVLQPEMTLPRLRIFGGRALARRVLSTAHICILTDRELVLIREDPESLKGCDNERYGGVWTYAPLRRVLGASVEKDAHSNPYLKLTLCGGSQLEILFEPQREQEINKQVSSINARTMAAGRIHSS